MNRDELLEEIRSLLGEPQAELAETPFSYTDEELIPQVRSALRHCRAKGVVLPTQVSAEGELVPALAEEEGVLIALRVAGQLLGGDLIRRMNEGEAGVFFRSGPDVVDTRDVAKQFTQAGTHYEREFQTMLLVLLARQGTDSGAVFSEQELSF